MHLILVNELELTVFPISVRPQFQIFKLGDWFKTPKATLVLARIRPLCSGTAMEKSVMVGLGVSGVLWRHHFNPVWILCFYIFMLIKLPLVQKINITKMENQCLHWQLRNGDKILFRRFQVPIDIVENTGQTLLKLHQTVLRAHFILFLLWFTPFPIQSSIMRRPQIQFNEHGSYSGSCEGK